MVAGLDLDYISICKCGFCKINKHTSQKIHRFVYEITTSYKIGSRKFWD